MALYSIQPAYQDQRARELRERNQRIQRAWKAYLGDLPPTLKVEPGKPDDNVLLGVRHLVDKGVSSLFGQSLKFELTTDGERDPNTDSPEEQYLAAVWRVNRQGTLLHKLGLNGSMTGHVFLKIKRAPLPGDMPRLIVLDPATLDVRHDPDDLERVVRYTIEYPGTDPETGKVWLYRQRHERAGNGWVIVDERADPDTLRWVLLNEEVWPFPFPAVVDCQNLPLPNQYWGLSDLEPDLLALNRSLCFLLSNLQKIVRYHAHPKTWTNGRASTIDISVDGIIGLPAADMQLHNLEMQSDLSSSITLYERLREAYYELARIPEVALGKMDNVGQLSGRAMQILYGPLIERTQTKQLTHGEMLAELNRRLLVLKGMAEVGQDVEIVTRWPELLPNDAKEEAETLQIHDQLGVSTRTILTKLGYDPDLEDEQKQAEQQRMDEQMGRLLDSGAGTLPTPAMRQAMRGVTQS